MPELRPKPEKEIPVDPNRFDMRSHTTDARGRVVGTNLYRIHMKDGNSYFERPLNSGNLWYENNEQAGRVEVVRGKNGKIIGKKFDFEAAHKAFKTPANAQEEMEQKLMEEKAKTAALEKELAAIRSEQSDANGMSRRVQGDEVHYQKTGEVNEETQKHIARSAKDAPLAARLTDPMSSSTPKDPTSGHAVPVSALADAIRAADAGQNADQKQNSASPQMPESDGKAHAPRPGPTPAAVHAKQAAEMPPRPASGPGSGPTPANVHAKRAADEAKGKL